ncbi:MAG: diaminobutyrate acetyltransferase [Chloroflexota bacterium]
MNTITYRHPQFSEGTALHQLVQTTPPLDVNSAYVYYLQCRDFASTCVVTTQEDTLLGFTTGYIRPSEPDTLFIWQIAVSPAACGMGVGLGMLNWLIQQPSCMGVSTVAATILRGNLASQSLFRKFARGHHAHVTTARFLPEAIPDDAPYADEILFSVSPISSEHIA